MLIIYSIPFQLQPICYCQEVVQKLARLGKTMESLHVMPENCGLNEEQMDQIKAAYKLCVSWFHELIAFFSLCFTDLTSIDQ